jgi:hypothetical protein
MPSFDDANIERVFLPSTASETDESKKRWVDLDLNLNAGKVFEVSSVEGMSDTERTFAILAKMIVDWNNTDANGEPVPVTVDALKKLGIADFSMLGLKVAKVMNPDGGDPRGHELKSASPADPAS